MPPGLLLGSLVVAGVTSGWLARPQSPAGDPRSPAPSISEALPTAISAISEAEQPVPPERTRPDSQLATAAAAALLQSHRAASVNPTPEIVCGMKLWRVDPDVDPAIHRQLPDEAFHASIRRIPPDRTCGAGARAVTGHFYTATIHSAAVKEPDPSVRK